MQKNNSIYFLGVGGTFVGSVALLARELGYTVAGVDEAIYPPMSNQLKELGIDYDEGYINHSLASKKNYLVVVGNAISRGNPALEYVLDEGLEFYSAPEWIAQKVLRGKHVLAVAGTHGKTTTSSMLAWLLDCAGLSPGFLIGGVPENFSASAKLGGGEYFVIEADEYDSAFCDKRSKFIHYRPRTLIVNNLEFDHADIFEDLVAIQTQFHHLVRTLPGSADVYMHRSSTLDAVVERGCWSKLHYLSGDGCSWQVVIDEKSMAAFTIKRLDTKAGTESEVGRVNWSLSGRHNVDNAVAAVAAASSVGVPVIEACAYLSTFKSVKRRMQHIASVDGVDVFDDFAHHPTAIRLTLEGARCRYPDRRIVAVIEAASNTMRSGVHSDLLPKSVESADYLWWYQRSDNGVDVRPPDFDRQRTAIMSCVEDMVAAIVSNSNNGDVIIVMSNGGFGGIHSKLVNGLQSA